MTDSSDIISEIPDERLVKPKKDIVDFFNNYPNLVIQFRELKDKLKIDIDTLQECLYLLIPEHKIQTTLINHDLYIYKWDDKMDTFSKDN